MHIAKNGQKTYIEKVVYRQCSTMSFFNFMEETKIEKKLCREVKKSGGIALKFVSPGYDGMPDRLILIALGHMAFVEVKARGKKPRKLQSKRHEMLMKMGFKVYVLDDENQIGGIIDEIRTL